MILKAFIIFVACLAQALQVLGAPALDSNLATRQAQPKYVFAHFMVSGIFHTERDLLYHPLLTSNNMDIGRYRGKLQTCRLGRGHEHRKNHWHRRIRP
jgi:hypothetical protein